MKLQGKVALITGASSAIGQEIVRLFLREGAQVVAADHFPVSMALLAKAFEETGHGALTTVSGDVSNRADAENMVYTALCTYGRLDIVINNAGPSDEALPAAGLNGMLRREEMECHNDGPMCICRKVIGPMLAQGGGVIVNVASGEMSGSRAGVSYMAASHGVIGLTRSIASHYAARGIRCNAISPNGVTQPEDMAQTALFLASDDSANVNGKMVVASAGWVAV